MMQAETFLGIMFVYLPGGPSFLSKTNPVAKLDYMYISTRTGETMSMSFLNH